MSLTVRDVFRERLYNGSLKIDFKGHNRYKDICDLSKEDKWIRKYYFDQITFGIIWFDIEFEEEYEQIKNDLIEGKELDNWLTLVEPVCLNDCGVCGQHLGYRTNGKIVEIIGEPCEYPGGIQEFSVEIDVPSGKLAFANDLREYFTEERDYYVNQTLEIVRCSEDYGRQGMIHFFVGNTCPGVHRQKNGSLFVGNYGWDDEGEKIVNTGELGDGIHVTSICTDLWWFSAVDYDLLASLANGKVDERDVGVVEVIPGRYKATSYYQHTHDSQPLYSKIELIRNEQSST